MALAIQLANDEKLHGEVFNFGPKIERNNEVINVVKKISETFSDKWHFDGSDKYILKLFILIKETTINHGPFHILDLKNTRLAIDKGYLSRRNYGLDENEFNRLSYKFIGGAGKRILAATNKCLHRASMPDYGLYRDMLVICFSPSDKKFDFNEIGNRISRMNFELL